MVSVIWRMAPSCGATLRLLTLPAKPPPFPAMACPRLPAATSAVNPAFPGGTIRMQGPLVLARYGETDDTWKPIFDDYLRGDMTKPHSAKKLIGVPTLTASP